MLDMGFKENIDEIMTFISKDEKIDSNNKKYNVLLFSATMPEWCLDLTKNYMNTDKITIDLIKNLKNHVPKQIQHLTIPCPKSNIESIIADVVLVHSGLNNKSLIFCPTKKMANNIIESDKIKTDVGILHGDIPQKQREVTMSMFKEGKIKVLVSTDVAARGLDLPFLDLVVQAEPPGDVETYVHRSGRTGRAGK